MSAFNTLEARVACPACGHEAPFEIQFKFGDTWQYEYVLGDSIRWGGNDNGSRTEGVAQVEGIGGPCPNCAADYLSFTITVIDDRIAAVAVNRE